VGSYVSALAVGKKKYFQWEDIASVVKRLHYLMRDPLNILKEGPVKDQKQAPPEEVVNLSHSEVDMLGEFLLSPECKVLANKKGLNDMLLTWLLREGRGYEGTVRQINLLSSIGATYQSVRELTVAIRRAMKAQDDVKNFLTNDSKLLPSVDGGPISIEHATAIYAGGNAGIFTLGLLKEMEREGKHHFDTLNALITALSEAKEHAHDQLLEFFSDMDCVLLNAVDDITAAQLNDLLVAGAGSESTLKILESLNNNHRTFLKMHDLLMAVHTKSGVPVAV